MSRSRSYVSPRRDDAARHTRARILDVAEQELERSGYHAMTIAGLAKRRRGEPADDLQLDRRQSGGDQGPLRRAPGRRRRTRADGRATRDPADRRAIRRCGCAPRLHRCRSCPLRAGGPAARHPAGGRSRRRHRSAHLRRHDRARTADRQHQHRHPRRRPLRVAAGPERGASGRHRVDPDVIRDRRPAHPALRLEPRRVRAVARRRRGGQPDRALRARAAGSTPRRWAVRRGCRSRRGAGRARAGRPEHRSAPRPRPARDRPRPTAARLPP